jgi:hypothetical protein
MDAVLWRAMAPNDPRARYVLIEAASPQGGFDITVGENTGRVSRPSMVLHLRTDETTDSITSVAIWNSFLRFLIL